MRLPVSVRFAWRELRAALPAFRIFLACLALGVAAIAAVGTVRESIRAGLEAEGAALLGGDAEIQVTYRFADAGERAWMEEIAGDVSEIADFRSMAVVDGPTGQERGLTQVKAVDDAYPLFGQVQLEPEIEFSEAMKPLGGLPGAVMDRILVDRLQLAPGGTFRLGNQDFVLRAVLVRSPDSATGGFTFGPRTIVRTQDLEASGLLAPGTLFESAYRLRLPPESNLDDLSAEAKDVFKGGGLRWRDSRDGTPGVSEFVARLGSFLILVGLAGLTVGGVGVSTAIRTYLEEKLPVIATLKTLGAEGRTIFQIYFIQTMALAFLGIFLGLMLGAGIPIALAPVLRAQLPLPIDVALHPQALFEAAWYGFLTAVLFTLWPLARTQKVKAAALFRDAFLGLNGRPGPGVALTMTLLFIILVLSAAFFSGQVRLTLWVAGGLIGAFVALYLAGLSLRVAARKIAGLRLLKGHPVLRSAFGSVGGAGAETVAVVLSLGLGLTVLSAIGQIDANLRGAIANDMPDVAPSFFVVDIQTGQLPAFRQRIENDPEVTRVQLAPMLRGMITEINGYPAIEVAGDHWVISGDRGITYSERPPDGTVVTEGTWWPEGYDGEPQISFSADEAEELGLNLGDRLTVNVLGRPITGVITSFREVDFSTAGMGFVLVMNPDAISTAPHTHLATIYANSSAEADILRDLSNGFPNITVIRVKEVIVRVAEILGSISLAVTYGALASVVTGAVVLVGSAAATERSRSYEAALLKTLGASRLSVLMNFSLRSIVMGTAAGLVAVATGSIAGWSVMTFLMETPYRFETTSAFVVIVGGIVVTLLSGMFFSLRSMAVRPARVLRTRE